VREQINISLPVELKARMRAAEKDHDDINWSKACRRAIEEELAAIEGRRDEQRRIEQDPDAT
jgi:hypothetical protein